MAHPDIHKKYKITTVPYIIINGKKPLIGNVGAKQILKQLIYEGSQTKVSSVYP